MPASACKTARTSVCIADPKINVLSRTRDARHVAKTLVSRSGLGDGFDETINDVSATYFSGDIMRYPSSD